MMDNATALEIVLAMASRLRHCQGEICRPATCPADVEEALALVQMYIMDNFGIEDDTEDAE